MSDFNPPSAIVPIFNPFFFKCSRTCGVVLPNGGGGGGGGGVGESINVQNLSVPANTNITLNNTIQVSGINSNEFFSTQAYIQVGYIFDQYTTDRLTKYSISGELLLYPQYTTNAFSTTSYSYINNFNAGAFYQTFNSSNVISYGATPTSGSSFSTNMPTGLPRFYFSSAPAAGLSSGFPGSSNALYLQSTYSNVTGSSATATFGFVITAPSATVSSGFSLQISVLNNPYTSAQITLGST